MKTALCAIGKNENDYILEFVEWYYNLGFTKLFLYDNNNVDGERFEDVIGDYISNGFVEIIDYRGKQICQFDAYNECYKNNKEYDWFAFFDCDEFLVINDFDNISDFLSQEKFNDYEMIHVNWLCYGDNNYLNNPEKKLNDYLTVPIMPIDFCAKYSIPCNFHIKTIVRNGLDVYFDKYSHTPTNREYKCCNPEGKKESSISPFNDGIYLKSAYLKHFVTKTIDEYVSNKMKRGYPDQTAEQAKQFLTVSTFFIWNTVTDEKIKYLKDKFGIDYEYRINVPIKLNYKSKTNLDLFILANKDIDVIPYNSEYKVILGENVNIDCPNEVFSVAGGKTYGEAYFINCIDNNLILKDYIGICPNGIYFSFFDKVPSYDEIENEFKRCDAIFPKPINVGKISEYYEKNHNIDDLNDIGNIINEKYPEFNKSFNDTITNNLLFTYNMFIMRKYNFHHFCKFAFDVLYEYDKMHDFKTTIDVINYINENKEKYTKEGIEIEKQILIHEYLFNILLNVFIRYKFKSILTTNIIDFSKNIVTEDETANKE